MENFIGVTKLIKNCVSFPFDDIAVANKIAKAKGVSPQALLRDWGLKRDIAAARGVAIHQYIESIIKGKPKAHPSGYQRECELFDRWFINTPSVRFYAEVPVRSQKYRVRGVVDCLTDTTITDWKTTLSFNKTVYRTLKPPFEYLNDDPITHASLQLHVYGLLLEKMPLEYMVVNITSQGIEQYDCLWLRDEAQAILDSRIQQ